MKKTCPACHNSSTFQRIGKSILVCKRCDATIIEKNNVLIWISEK
jgi:ribosomal protein L37AE/L43A